MTLSRCTILAQSAVVFVNFQGCRDMAIKSYCPSVCLYQIYSDIFSLIQKTFFSNFLSSFFIYCFFRTFSNFWTTTTTGRGGDCGLCASRTENIKSWQRRGRGRRRMRRPLKIQGISWFPAYDPKINSQVGNEGANGNIFLHFQQLSRVVGKKQ